MNEYFLLKLINFSFNFLLNKFNFNVIIYVVAESEEEQGHFFKFACKQNRKRYDGCVN